MHDCLRAPTTKPAKSSLGGGQQTANPQLAINQNVSLMQAQASGLGEDAEHDSSVSETEDGELSEGEVVQQDPPGIRLFYQDQFPRHLHRILFETV